MHFKMPSVIRFSLDQSEILFCGKGLKHFAEDKVNMTDKLKFVLGKVE